MNFQINLNEFVMNYSDNIPLMNQLNILFGRSEAEMNNININY